MTAEPDDHGGATGSAQLRLYIAASTPNSVRAEQNLAAACTSLGDRAADIKLDVIDVFVNGRRAIHDGVIVTPTLVVVYGAQRYTIVGDLSDSSQLLAILARISGAST